MIFDCIIPTYNNLEELKRCLEGFSLQSFREFRLLICVDGSTDGTLEWLRTAESDIELNVCEHADKQNHGRNATRNLALPHLSAPYLCFVDSDLVPDVDLLQRHYEILSTRECVSVGEVIFTNADTNAWAAYANTRGKNKYRDGAVIPYYYLATGNCAHRTSLFAELGGQDPRIIRYGGGDTEYALRLHKHSGIPVVFNASARVKAEMNKSLDEALTQLEEFGRTNLHYIHAKHPTETRIFFLWRLIGTEMRHQLFRLVLQLPLYSVLRLTTSIAPSSVANRIINYLVLVRIFRGWKRGGA